MEVCKTPCERSPKIGRSWWKLLGYNSPCSCAEKAYKEYEEKQKMYEERIRPIMMKLYQQAGAPGAESEATGGPKVEEVD